MKILSRKKQIECIKRLNYIRMITDDMNEKAYGEEVKKWAENVEYLADNIIEIANIVYGIQGMQLVDYFVRKDMSKQLKEQYKADTNLKDIIKDIHDNVAQEMYCKGIEIYKQIRADAIDDFANWLVEQGILGNRCVSDGKITDYGKVYAKKYKEQLKVGGKNE